MRALPKISVITPSLNQARFIERTICSVLDQDYPYLEYIIMDGGSSDGTITILEKYEKRLKWFSQKDHGQADAINKGVSMATGDIIAYINSDDIYQPGALRMVGEYFSTHPEIKWLTGKCKIIDEHDCEIRRSITVYKNFLLRHYSYSLLLVTNPISQPATFWRRAVVDEFGLLDKTEHLVMDYDYWLRVGGKYRPAVLDEYLASFRVYSMSKTSRAFLVSFKRELRLARKYSSSALLNGLHCLSYSGIASIYLLLAFKTQFLAAIAKKPKK